LQTFVQHVNELGDPNWLRSGLPIVGDSSRQTSHQITADREHNLFVAWQDANGGAIYAQKITLTGTRVWGINGLPLSLQSSDYSTIGVCADQQGGALTIWGNRTSSAYQLVGAYVNARGELASDEWTANGVPLMDPCDNLANNPMIARDGAGGFVIGSLYTPYREMTWESSVSLQRVRGGATEAVKESADLPRRFALEQNYPNPFNPTTEIRFELMHDGKTILKVFDVLGREVQTLVNGQLRTGEHKVQFDGANLPSGIYFYRLEAGNSHAVKKMVMIK
jgi:hypothetical protein